MSERYWKLQRFKIAYALGPVEVRGRVSPEGTLGIYRMSRASPKGRRKAKWELTHLNSGHRIGSLLGEEDVVLLVADEIVQLGDWGFEGLKGFRNIFPDAQERVREVALRHPDVFDFGEQGTGAHEGIAQAIAITRA